MGHRLGGIDHTAAAYPENEIGFEFLCGLCHRSCRGDERIGNHTAFGKHFDAVLSEIGFDPIKQAAFYRGLAAVNNKHSVTSVFSDKICGLILRIFSEDDFRRCEINKFLHIHSFYFWVRRYSSSF